MTNSQQTKPVKIDIQSATVRNGESEPIGNGAIHLISAYAYRVSF